MNPLKNKPVTRGPWNYGGQSGYGVPAGMVRVEPFRMFGEGLFLRPAIFGQVITWADYDRIGLKMGFLQYYGRNTCRFQSNRSYRRHMGRKAYQTLNPDDEKWFVMSIRNHYHYLLGQGITPRV